MNVVITPGGFANCGLDNVRFYFDAGTEGDETVGGVDQYGRRRRGFEYYAENLYNEIKKYL